MADEHPPTPPQDSSSPEAMKDQSPEIDPKYSDLLLIDLLHPDWKHFFSRYRTDLIGFAIITVIVVFIIFATKYLAMIGASAG